MDVAHDEIGDRDGIARPAEKNGAIPVVGQARVPQFLDPTMIAPTPLTLKIRPAISPARTGSIGTPGTLVPIHSQPAQALEDDVDRRLRISGQIRITTIRSLVPQHQLVAIV